MHQDHKLYTITRNLGLPEIDLFTTMAQILEAHRPRVEEHHPEFLDAYDKVGSVLWSRQNLEPLALVGDDNRTGRFSIRIAKGAEPVQFNVWAYPGGLPPQKRFRGRSRGRSWAGFHERARGVELPGDLLRWRGSVLARRARTSYYKALGLLNTILANGGLVAVSPSAREEDVVVVVETPGLLSAMPERSVNGTAKVRTQSKAPRDVKANHNRRKNIISSNSV